MKLAVSLSAVALMASPVEARRGGRGGHGRRGGFNPLPVLESCQEELSFDCVAVDVTSLISDLTTARDQAEAGGTRPQLTDDNRADLESVRQCIGSIREELKEDSVCLAAISGKGGRGGKGGKKGGKGGRGRPVCADESRPACDDGSTPTKTRGEAPVCEDGANPVCDDGSAPERPERPEDEDVELESR